MRPETLNFLMYVLGMLSLGTSLRLYYTHQMSLAQERAFANGLNIGRNTNPGYSYQDMSLPLDLPYQDEPMEKTASLRRAA